MKLRPLAKSFVSYAIGNGDSISFWFDPWVQGHSIASAYQDSIIAGSGVYSTVKDHIGTGTWQLPVQLRNDWLPGINLPVFNLTKPDIIYWDGNASVTISAIWNSLRPKGVL